MPTRHPPSPSHSGRPTARLGRNPRLLCAYRALQMTLFPVAVITLFWRHQLDMSMAQIMLLQGLFGLFVAVSEFPAGYVADRIGYRSSLIVGALVAAVAWIIYSASHSFGAALAAEALLAVALALISGTDAALLYESLVERGEESSYGRWFGRLSFWGQSAEGTAALLAGLLYTIWVRLPFVLEVGVWLANAVLAGFLVEPARQRPPVQGTWAQVRAIFRHAAIDSARLRAVMLLGTAIAISSFVPVWILPLYATDAGLPVEWLGPVWAAANYVVAGAALASPRVGKRFGLMATLLGSIVLVAIGYVGLAASQATAGFLFYYCLTAARGLHSPVLHHEEQRLIPSSDRAAFLSLRSLLFRMIFFVIGPLIGMAIDRTGAHPVLWVAGAVLSLASLAGWVALDRARPGGS